MEHDLASGCTFESRSQAVDGPRRPETGTTPLPPELHLIGDPHRRGRLSLAERGERAATNLLALGRRRSVEAREPFASKSGKFEPSIWSIGMKGVIVDSDVHFSRCIPVSFVQKTISTCRRSASIEATAA